MSVLIRRDLERVADVWDDLADRADAPPWLRPGWAIPWWRAFGRGRPELVCVLRGGRLAAVLPMGRRLGEARTWSNYHTPRIGILAEDADAAASLAEAVFRRRPHRVTVRMLGDDETLAVLSDAARSAGYRVLIQPIEPSPFVTTEGGWEAYERERSAKLLREINRRRRLLESRGTLRLEVEHGTSRLDELLQEGFRVEASGWKGERGTAIASRPETATFYREVARWAAQRGWLRLAFLRLDARPLAFDYSLEAGGVHYLLKTGYDPELRRLGPGVLLRHEMLARAFAGGLARYEFLGADADWKREWTDRVMARWWLRAFAPSVSGLAGWAGFRFGRPIARRLVHGTRSGSGPGASA